MNEFFAWFEYAVAKLLEAIDSIKAFFEVDYKDEFDAIKAELNKKD